MQYNKYLLIGSLIILMGISYLFLFPANAPLSDGDGGMETEVIINYVGGGSDVAKTDSFSQLFLPLSFHKLTITDLTKKSISDISVNLYITVNYDGPTRTFIISGTQASSAIKGTDSIPVSNSPLAKTMELVSGTKTLLSTFSITGSALENKILTSSSSDGTWNVVFGFTVELTDTASNTVKSGSTQASVTVIEASSFDVTLEANSASASSTVIEPGPTPPPSPPPTEAPPPTDPLVGYSSLPSYYPSGTYYWDPCQGTWASLPFGNPSQFGYCAGGVIESNP